MANIKIYGKLENVTAEGILADAKQIKTSLVMPVATYPNGTVDEALSYLLTNAGGRTSSGTAESISSTEITSLLTSNGMVNTED